MSNTLYLTEFGDAGPIEPTDINQGDIGDCFLLSSIGEIALQDPAAIQNMIRDNGNGTQTVTLYEQTGYTQQGAATFAPEQETVSDTNFVPGGVNRGGQTTVNGVTEIWPQVLEEAYAQQQGGVNAIANGGYPWQALESLTGLGVTIEPTSAVAPATLQADFAAKDPIVLDTATSGSLPYGLVNDHAYMLTGFENVGGVEEATALNPWGFDEPQAIPLIQLSTAFNYINIGATGAPNTQAPYTPPPPAATEDLQLNMSEDAFQGDAQFLVTVDGQQIGGVYTVTAPHSGVTYDKQGVTGSEVFDLGTFSNTQHQIGITFLNDAYGGSPQADRNLYLDGVQFSPNADQISGGPLLTLDGYGAGTAQTSTVQIYGQNTPPPATPGLVLNMSEDAWMGDAQYLVDIDGQQVGGIRTATTPHSSQDGAAGRTQFGSSPVDLGVLAPGQHTVTVDFLNDAYDGSPSEDRNLYVNSATYNGQTIQGSTLSECSGGPQSFSFTATQPTSATPGTDDTVASITSSTLGSASTAASPQFIAPSIASTGTATSAGSTDSLPAPGSSATQFDAADFLGGGGVSGTSQWSPDQSAHTAGAWASLNVDPSLPAWMTVGSHGSALHSVV